MTQKRLTSVIVCAVHRQIINSLDIYKLAKEDFASRTAMRVSQLVTLATGHRRHVRAPFVQTLMSFGFLFYIQCTCSIKQTVIMGHCKLTMEVFAYCVFDVKQRSFVLYQYFHPLVVTGN
jgi:hypothetical protein